MSRVARKFERLLEAYRREDGGKWGGIELERATGGDVTRSYVTNLRKGRIENPGMDKLAAMATAMGFSPCSLVRGGADRRRWKGSAGPPAGLAGRVERLFDVIKDPKTGEAYTNSKIARMSLGDLTEQSVTTCSTSPPTVASILRAANSVYSRSFSAPTKNLHL